MSSAISNLQLRIQDVHIRYEDLDSITGKSFAWGLLIKSAQSENAIPSTGGSGSPGSGDLPSDAKSYVSQQLQLKGVSLYWDQDAFHVGGLELNRMAVSRCLVVVDRTYIYIYIHILLLLFLRVL